MSDATSTWTSPLLDLLFEEPSVGRCLVAPDSTVLRANAEWLRSTSLTLDEVLGASIIELFPEVRDMALAMHARARAGHRVEVPRHAQRLQGRETWWEGSIDPVPLEGGTGLLVSAREIGKPSDDLKYRSLFESSLDAVFLTRHNGQILDANRAASRMLGMTVEEMRQRGRTGLVIDDDRMAVALKQRETTGNAHAEIAFTRKDGSTFDAEVESVVVDPDRQDWTAFVVARDITERKRADGALRQSEERLRALVEASSDAVYRMSPDWREMRQLLGRGFIADTERPNQRWLQEYIHPDDQPQVTAAIDEAIRTRKPFQLEHRVLRVDGSVGWTFSRAIPMLGPNEEIVEWIGAATDVTERRRLAEARRGGEERLRQTLKDAQAGAWEWDLASGQLTWAPELYDLFGMDPAAGIDYARWERRVHTEDLDAVNSAGRDAAEGRRPEYRGEFRILHPSRGERWILSIGRLEAAADGTPRALRGLNIDITERKQAEEAVMRERAMLGTTVDLAPVGITIVDAHGAILRVNDAVQRMWGGAAPLSRSVEEYREYKGWWPESGEPLRSEDWPPARVLSSGEPVEDQRIDIERFDGTRGSLLVSGVPVRGEHGQITGAVIVSQDITERSRIEAALETANKELRDEQQRKDKFLAVLSHELRNPLSSIQNSIHLLHRAPERSDTARRARAVLQRQTDHLTRLVDDLLDVTRISHGKIELQLARIDVRDVVRRACDDIRAVFEQRSVALRYSLPAEPTWVVADDARLAQMIGNLVNNALKFTPRGGKVNVAVHAGERGCEVSVRDTGAGLLAADLERIFEPFVQAGRTGHSAQSGLGIGLSLVRELATRHGGAVRAASAGLEQGSEFVLTLPLAAAPEVAAPRPEAGRGVPRLSILIVEDNEDAGASLADLLAMNGHEVKVVATGRAGIEAVTDHAPDVLICDVGLPDVNGFEVIRALRATGATVFAVALTGYAQPQDRQLALDAGFDAHLAKPPALDKLDELLAKAAKKKG